MNTKFLNKKKNRNQTQNKENTKFDNVQNLYTKAKKLYEEKAAFYSLDNEHNVKDKKWTQTILKTGTFEDKISALCLYIKANPQMCLKYIDDILKLAKKKNRRQTEAGIVALKDLFLNDILTNRKLVPFFAATENLKEDEITNDKLIQFYVDDFVHKKYLEHIKLIEDILINEPLKQIKKKFMSYILEMLVRRPEREEILLDALVNKLGDPDVDIANTAIKMLKNLQETHSRMSLVILNNVSNFMARTTNYNTKFYALVFLTQMNLVPNNNFLEAALKFFFDLFSHYSQIENEQDYVKSLSLIVKMINDICRFTKEKNINVKELLEDKLETLFRLSHSKSIRLRVETLNLIFNVAKSKDSKYLDRYYRTLYELLQIKEISSSKHLKSLLKLVQTSLLFDSNITRVAAFLKQPTFITCILIIVSQVLRNKNKLWKMVETKTSNIYDNNKRDPLFTNADEFPLTEMVILSNHYHPTVQKFCTFVLENYKKDTIDYQGDPLVDFSLANFLDKFILKNPKLSKNKKKAQTNNEDEELKKFLGEDEVENNKADPCDQFDFIDKFNKINKAKMQKKKLKFKEDDIDDFANKVMDDEYKKYDRDVDDIDEDVFDFDDEDDEN